MYIYIDSQIRYLPIFKPDKSYHHFYPLKVIIILHRHTAVPTCESTIGICYEWNLSVVYSIYYIPNLW